MDPMMLLMLAGLVGLMFFMSSRQRKAARVQQEFRSSLGIGSQVMTTAGLIGTIVAIDEANDRVTIDSAGSRSVWTRAAVAKQIETLAAEVPEMETVTYAVPETENSALSELDTVAREYRASQQ